MISRYIERLDQLKETGNYRKLFQPKFDNFINFCSNDYLGVLEDQEIRENFLKSDLFLNTKFGSGSSRLLDGNNNIIISLEDYLANEYCNFPDSSVLVFNSGYHLNTGVIPAITEKGDLIISDMKNHASIIDGMRLSNAEFKRYRHNDMNHLESILKKFSMSYNKIFVITESLFSMDGDFADLHNIIELKKKYNFFLYVDEAHSFGVYGENNLGYCESLDILNQVDLLCGTFGKAIGSIGAFILTNKILKNYLINHCRSFIYSTALPPVNIAFTRFVLGQKELLKYKVNNLRKNISLYNELFNCSQESQIKPIIIGNSIKTVQLSEYLMENNIYSLAVRPPTVSQGSSRLRISLNSNHTDEQINKIKILIDSFMDKKKPPVKRVVLTTPIRGCC
ncbi:MAG: pyridoxal phosphate-dependent aminotransferase family protein [Candidatus Delongbacteria bacterium]|nr:pyridoxal phosphate-dependent aminotransferase family protein [Candidatus Delongbacteria bacterium]MBN2836013.1 pyridoxal phosphate-dependent aminotransferase family protein [Candidatus Delongbacteria bacterium]